MNNTEPRKLPVLPIAVALVLIALVIVLVVVLQPGKPDAAQATATPVVTDAPAVTAAPAATDAPAAAQTATDALPATSGNPDDVMATVNGTPVTRAELDAYTATMVSYYAGQGYDTSDAEFMAILQQMSMQTLVQYILMDQQVVAMGLSLTAEEKATVEAAAKEEWQGAIDDGLSYYGITETSTEDERATVLVQVLAELESMGYTEQSYIEESVKYAGYDKLQNEIVKDVTVSDEQVVAHFNELVAADEVAYKNNAEAYETTQQMNQMYAMYGMSDYVTDLYYTPEGYRGMSHILLTPDEAVLTAYQELSAKFEEQQSALEEGSQVTDELVTLEQLEAARLAVIANVQPTLDEINAKLAEGAQFAGLIPQYSQDPGMMDAATIAAGYEVHMDSVMWDPVFRDAAFTVNTIGEITAPVVGSYGVHVLQYVRDIPSGPVALTADMQAALKEELLFAAQSNAYSEVAMGWEANAEIVYSAEAQAFMPVAE